MPRSDVESLKQEVRAMEMLANEADVPLERMPEYWDLAADLIALSTDVAEFEATQPRTTFLDPDMLALRRRIRYIASRLSELSLE